ncbi:hypothetical protein KSP40_PGU022017 [Platanthera guangdongensis]|uniref:Josephin-like protein n=1 Tax=Platanthera guangdongensis TaxID=2320717 RepID=A0ABR2LWC7_9ASPA
MPTLARNGSKRASFSPHDTNSPMPQQSLMSYMDVRPQTKSRPEARECRWSGKQTPARLRSFPARILRRIKANVSRTLSFLSTKQPSCSSSSRSRQSNPIPAHFIPPRDSHHSEALEDCIEFINSSHRKSL